MIRNDRYFCFRLIKSFSSSKSFANLPIDSIIITMSYKPPRHSVQVDSNGNNHHRSSISLRVCKAFEDPNYIEDVLVYTDETMRQFKEKICRKIFPYLQPDLFYLTLLDSGHNTWVRIRESKTDELFSRYGIPSSSILNVVTYARICSHQQSSEITLPVKSLILKLCRRPMDKEDFTPIVVERSTSLGDLKRKADTHVTNQNTDHLYRCIDDKWVVCEKQVEDLSLEQ